MKNNKMEISGLSKMKIETKGISKSKNWIEENLSHYIWY